MSGGDLIDEILDGRTPVASYGPRDHAWLHPFRPWYVRLEFLKEGRPHGGCITYYCRDAEEAELRADHFISRWRETVRRLG